MLSNAKQVQLISVTWCTKYDYEMQTMQNRILINTMYRHMISSLVRNNKLRKKNIIDSEDLSLSLNNDTSTKSQVSCG